MYHVTLSHAQNPDIGRGGYWGHPVDGRKKVAIATLREAAEECRRYIDRNDLGGGNWTGGQVFKGREQVARVSYNGRVWAMDGSEITPDVPGVLAPAP